MLLLPNLLLLLNKLLLLSKLLLALLNKLGLVNMLQLLKNLLLHLLLLNKLMLLKKVASEDAVSLGRKFAAGQAAAAVHPTSPPTISSTPPSSPPLAFPPLALPPSTAPPSTRSSPTLKKCSVTTHLPPPVTVPLPPTETTPVKSKKGRPRATPSLDQDPQSQVECPICYKLIQPRLMANHAKYFHVTSDLGVECPKCEFKANVFHQKKFLLKLSYYASF